MKKFLAAAGVALALSSTAFAAEAEPREDLVAAETAVNGVIRDVAQKILPVSVEARYFAPHMDLNVQTSGIRYNGGSVGLKSDLGFGNDGAPELLFRYKRFNLDYIHVHGSGDRNFSTPLTFDGRNFTGDVHAKSDLDYLKLSVRNPIISVLGTGVDWSYGLTGVQWKGEVSNASGSTSKKYGAPIPTLGIGGHVAPWPSMMVYANVSGLPFGGYGHLYDFEAGFRYSPLEILGIDVGYRKIHAKLKHKDDSGTLDLDGPFAGIRVDF